MSRLGGIIIDLANIKKQLETIDLTKETDVKKISEMGTKPISKIDEIIGRDDFGEEHLASAVEFFGEANNRVAMYHKEDDLEEIRKAAADVDKLKEINEKMKAKEATKKAIQEKYDELSKKQIVLNKYKEMYDPQYFVDKENDKLEVNNKKIETNKTRVSEITDFKEKVSGELDTVKVNVELLDELKKLQDQIKNIETRENNLNAQRRVLDPDAVKLLEEDLEKVKKDLESKATNVTKKHKGVTLDPKNLKSSIPTVEATAKNNIQAARNTIGSKVNGAEKNFNYTAGFETFIQTKISEAKTDKDFVEVFDNAKAQLRAENINLDVANRKISENVSTIERGETLRKNGTRVMANLEPTEEEIQKAIELDPEIKALIPMSKKDKSKLIYDSLVEGSKRKSPFLHPIAFLKSRFDKGARENWQMYDKEIRQKAIDKIKAHRKENATAVKASKTMESAFRKSLAHTVISAKKDDLDEMSKNADSDPGKVLVDAYEKASKGFEPGD